MDSAVILEAFKVLSSPQKTTACNGGGGEKTEREQIDQQLHTNLETLAGYLGKHCRLEQLFDVCGSPWDQPVELIPPGFTEAGTRWRFVTTSCRLLQVLCHVLENNVKEYMQSTTDVKNAAKMSHDASAPPMAPDTFSSEQQKALVADLQFVVCLGILPFLYQGVGVPLERRSGFADIFKEKFSLRTAEHDVKLVYTIKVLLHCLKQPSLSHLILSRHFSDMLASLCQITFGPRQDGVTERTCWDSSRTSPEQGKGKGKADSNSPGVPGVSEPKAVLESVRITNLDEERSYCRNQLKDLLERVSQPLVVRELLVLQAGPGSGRTGDSVGGRPPGLVGSPGWLRKVCGRLLSERLMKSHGVKNVIQGMLQDPHAQEPHRAMFGSVDWRKCNAIARIIASCPTRSKSVEEYYAIIAPQVLELVKIKDESLLHFLRVGVSSMAIMLRQHPKVAQRFLVEPLLQPLLSCLDDQEICAPLQVRIVVNEQPLADCLHDLQRVFVDGSQPDDGLLSWLLPVLHPVFNLLCFMTQGVGHLRSLCKDILRAVLRSSEEDAAVAILRFLTFGRADVGHDSHTNLRLMHPNTEFRAGDSGGAVIVTRSIERVGVQGAPLWELRSRCVIEVVKATRRDDLSAAFFLSMLKDLTEVIRRQVATPGEQCPEPRQEEEKGEKILLGIEDRQEEEERQIQRSVTVLHLLAGLAEDLGPTCFTDPKHILDFIKTTLERCVQVLRATDDQFFGMFENETVTMAMSMLTALMGGAAEVNEASRHAMEELLPLLEEFVNHHPDPSIQEMATDLRIAIATRGIVWSDLLKGKDKDKSKEKGKRGQVGEGPSVVRSEEGPALAPGDEADPLKKRPLIEVISSIDADVTASDVTASDITASDVTASDVTASESEPGSQDVNKDTSGQPACKPESEFQQALHDLCDPLIPARGHALIVIRRLVERRDPETLDNEQVLLKVFRENLDHGDSYLYLAAVQGLAALADRLHPQVIPTLAAQYADFPTGHGGQGQRSGRSAELRMKIGEVLVKTCRSLGELAPRYRDLLLPAFLSASRDQDPLVRASSVSNLGDLCKLLRYSLASDLQEVFTCVSSLVKSDPEVEVRRAAALFTVLLLEGAGNDVTKVLDNVLRDFYRLLKHVLVIEKDEIVRDHVTAALNELDNVMRSVLFPQQTLTKKIRVLDPE